MYKRQEQEKAEEELHKARERYEKQCRNKKLVVKEEDIAEVVSDWTKIPVKKLAEGESKRLARLEHILHRRVIGQDAVSYTHLDVYKRQALRC